MTRVKPIERADPKELEPMLKLVEASMGFVPESMLTMAIWPELLPAFAALERPEPLRVNHPNLRVATSPPFT